MSWGYPREVSGSFFRLEIHFYELRLWITGQPEPQTIKTAELQSFQTQPDGSTKLAIQFHKDLVIPTSSLESTRVIDALDALLNERLAREERDREAFDLIKDKVKNEKARLRQGRRASPVGRVP